MKGDAIGYQMIVLGVNVYEMKNNVPSMLNDRDGFW